MAEGRNGGKKRRGEGGNMQEREDRNKHRIGKKNALKLLCSLSCCFFLLAKGIWRCYTFTVWPKELHHFFSSNLR